MRLSGSVSMVSGVSGWYLEVSGWCLGMYQYQIHLQEIMLGQILPFLQMPYFTSNCLCLGVSGWCLDGVWGCLDGVWLVSGWSHSDSGCCQQGINAKTSNKSSISVTVLRYAIFFQWPRRGLFSPRIRTSQNVNLARKECSNQKV